MNGIHRHQKQDSRDDLARPSQDRAQNAGLRVATTQHTIQHERGGEAIQGPVPGAGPLLTIRPLRPPAGA